MFGAEPDLTAVMFPSTSIPQRDQKSLLETLGQTTVNELGPKWPGQRHYDANLLKVKAGSSFRILHLTRY